MQKCRGLVIFQIEYPCGPSIRYPNARLHMQANQNCLIETTMYSLSKPVHCIDSDGLINQMFSINTLVNSI